MKQTGKILDEQYCLKITDLQYNFISNYYFMLKYRRDTVLLTLHLVHTWVTELRLIGLKHGNSFPDKIKINRKTHTPNYR